MKTNDTSEYAFDIEPPTLPNDGILFVNHSTTGRSGHLGHALVEYAHGNILAFYPNCSVAVQGERLLIQASHVYETKMMNIHHWWLT